MSILIRKSGILTTFQDAGRFGYRVLGVNPSGPMDTVAARISNILVGNDEYDAVIETHFPAVEIEFLRNTQFSICGAEFCATLDGKPLSNWSSHMALAGQKLSFQRPALGSRAYIAAAGGIEAKSWLGSWSSIQISANDQFSTLESKIELRSCTVSPWMLPRYGRFPTVRIIRGPEFDLLDDIAVDLLLSENYTLSKGANRMGARLDGSPINCDGIGEMTSSAVTFGTIQLLPNGLPVILMANHQTTGGYPRIGTVISADLPLVGQLSAGDGVSFKLIDMSEAIELYNDREREIEQLKRGVSLFGRTVSAK